MTRTLLRLVSLSVIAVIVATGIRGAFAQPTPDPPADARARQRGADPYHHSWDPFVAGNAAAAAGDHAAAAAAFERAIAVHGWAPGTLFDLGNAYAGAGRPGRAILAYERGRLLAPRDAAIVANLARVRETAGVPSPPSSKLDRAVGQLTADEWSWIAVGGAAAGCVGLVGLAWAVRRGAARTLALAGAIATALAAAAAVHVAPPTDRAIVVTGETARIAPFAGAEAAFTAPEGTDVRIEQARGEDVYVRDGDRAGWLPRAAVERVVGTVPPG